ncbi:tyrosine-type recombinase/integrase [Devosia faecipullorum]|uniref:tyrosine-type recombinase/integrase n=1 Tax=Devosia faecipullorum TaxID=2755039 RepID=UPI00187B2C5D|nr:site-specific integrase [Devosia faecipullorum]MBE7731464.1 site-specific integrase [Devosia faecipullorum]
MSVFTAAKTPFYQYEFQVHRRVFRGSTKARSKKEALAVEKELKAKARADMEQEKRTGNGPLTLDLAAGRYWEEVGKHLANSGTTWTDLDRLIKFFSGDTRLDQITDREVAGLVSWRRGQTKQGRAKKADGTQMQLIAPATVNRSTTVLLKSLFTRARRTWRYQFPMEPNWKDHTLKEPEERVRFLKQGEGEKLDAAVRDDYGPWFTFCRLTGLRHKETLIRWKDVNWFAKRITTIGKGGRIVSTPITPTIKALLEPLIGHHPEFVFTYVCRRPDTPHAKAAGQVKGQRYPITPDGAKSQWRRMKARAGVDDFRFHDIRHDVATKLLKQTGNLRLVQKALNHADIATTTKYAHVMDDELSAALETLASPQKIPQTTLKQAG